MSREKTDDSESDGARAPVSLIGHEAAERLFLDAFNSDRLHHGWLITGPRGIGKASLAWRIARFLSTQGEAEAGGLFGEALAPTSLDVDLEATAVRRVISGAHGDMHELRRTPDPKKKTDTKLRKEIAVDQVRALIDRFNQTTAEGGWRVAVIDAVDEMNRSAANALLKLLEEPPAKSLLLLVCHAPGRLLPTIRSRCRTLALKPLGSESVSAVVAGRFPEAAPDDLALAAYLADGAPGRAIHLLEADGLSLYREILGTVDAVSRGRLMAAHTLADKLSGARADKQFAEARAILIGLIERIVRASSGAQAEPVEADPATPLIQRHSATAGLDHWLGLWEKVAHRMERLDAVNLDRRQVIVSLLSEIHQTSQRARA